MSDLAEFLLARISEDEMAASSTGGQRWSADVPRMVHADPQGRAKSRYVAGVDFEVDAAHIARWDPARVLAECEAKREVIRLSQFWVGKKAKRPVLASAILARLALPYADHPDYRQEWRP